MNGYISEQELFNYRVKYNAEKDYGSFLYTLVMSYINSLPVMEAVKASRYYDADHLSILNKQRCYYIEGKKQVLPDDEYSNNKIVNPFFSVLVDQKAAYITGNPINVSVSKYNNEGLKANSSIEQDQTKFVTALGMDFNDKITDWIVNASIQGRAWVHPFITSSGKFDFMIIPSSEIIGVYDTNNETELKEVYRFYKYEYINNNDYKNSKMLYKLEVWNKDGVTYYTEDTEGRNLFIKDTSVKVNPAPHYFLQYGNGNVINKTWASIPFIKLDNNSRAFSDLKRIKTLINLYDSIISGWADDLASIQEAVIILKGYAGMRGKTQGNMSELEVFMQNMKTHHVIDVSEGGDVDYLKVDIPVEAKEKLLKIIRYSIYHFGEGIDTDSDKFGNNPSGISLKFLYAPLDLKANAIINKLIPALSLFTGFMIEFLNLSGIKLSIKPEDIIYTINKSIIFNEKEKIDSVKASDGIISRQTMLENHPWVKDVEEEQKRIEAEDKLNMDKALINLDAINNNNNNSDTNANV